MRKLSAFLAFIFCIQNVSFAYMQREIEVNKEKLIPFSYSSDSQLYSGDLSIRGLSNVKIEDVYVDNGNVDANISGNYIELDFSDGKEISGTKNVVKTGTYDIDDAIVEEDGSLVINTGRDVVSVDDVLGDFSEAKIKSSGDIEVILSEYADGVWGYDEDNIVSSTFNVRIDDTNKSRKIESDAVILLHNPIGDIKPVSGDTSNVQKINADNNTVRVTFNYGIPLTNEINIKSGYTYCWVDRDENGEFKIYKPNSVYSTDINKITGLGEYLDENDYDEIGLSVSNALWEDYLGVEVNGVRYVYVLDKNSGIPKDLESDLISGNSICIDEQNFNSEKYTVNFSNTDVSYIPEGKLYSMGELVANTSGWGEVYPNNANESKKTFFNEFTGKYETYVKHFKFFYGPHEKKTFGGYYTYPYNCEFEYEHYKPVKYYSGEIVYSYNDTMQVDGYLYSGWVKVSYDERKTVNDYPPTSPFNIKYNIKTGEASWNAGNDDYTPNEKLIYEIEIYLDDWELYKKTNEGITSDNCPKNLTGEKIRIRTVDEGGQASSWAYASDSEIEVAGSILPYIVKPGDMVDISAIVKSFSKVESVVAENDKLQMYAELQKTSESSPEFFEMSYDLEADFPEYEDEYIVVSNGIHALGSKDEHEIIKFKIGEKFENGVVNVELVEDIKFNKNGTLIFSNQNYLNTPVKMFRYDGNYWHLNWYSEIEVFNKVLGKSEVLFSVESVAKSTAVGKKYAYVPVTRIKFNKFVYNTNGNSTYDIVEIEKDLAKNPFVITWNTDVSGVTEFKVFFENELVYNFSTAWDNINKYVDNFFSINMYKRIKKYTNASYGYITPSKSQSANWPKIVLNIAVNRNLQDFLWLGYRVRNNEYVKSEYVDGYNSNPQVRNNYRLFIADDSISDLAIKRYIEFLKVSNIPITRDKSTVWGDDVLQYTSGFEAKNILVPEDSKPGRYEILLTAKDFDGNIDSIVLTLIVQDDEEFEEDENAEEDTIEKIPEILDYNIGRFFYKNSLGYLEDLKKTSKNPDTNGFICAGETLGFVINTKNTEYIDVDFIGDNSIKTFDKLTEKFLVSIPNSHGKNITNLDKEYKNFPLRIYPHTVDNSGNAIFKYFYTIPYSTKQSLESWSSLKDSTLERIDKVRLFDRKSKCYEAVIYLNGDVNNCIKFNFDVFERWDTVLNRDVSKFITNSSTKWEMRVDK